ncbi:MAG TPA: lipocalin-like domain-containing protein [Steroidobacteraceae bacterium]|jgi:predicted secreted hydrolase|nr:lipocalin-like domain-containing protein [Steroidobacteraceae bacterium]
MRSAAGLAGLLAALACAAAGGAPPAEPGVLGSGEARGFAAALAPRPFEFPRDHGPHPEFRHEWWYLTGNLDAADGERFGFELTFFRFALAPPPAPGAIGAASPPAQPRSAWRAREIYMAHFAVSDVARGRFRYAHKLSRAALGLAGAQAEPLRVWIDDWSLRAAAAGTGGRSASWTLAAAQPGYALELTLRPLEAPVPNGRGGLSRKSDRPADASYYYSIPRLEVHGRLLRDGVPLEVQGLAWLDREWGSGALGASETGWDWFALQLDDGSTLMFYALRDRDGARDPHSAGTWVASSGAVRALSSPEVQIEVTDHWTDAAGVRYPAAWRVRVPALALDLAVHPVLADQELEVRPRYYEGAVDASGDGSGHERRGRGYVELVGYAGER